VDGPFGRNLAKPALAVEQLHRMPRQEPFNPRDPLVDGVADVGSGIFRRERIAHVQDLAADVVQLLELLLRKSVLDVAGKVP